MFGDGRVLARSRKIPPEDALGAEPFFQDFSDDDRLVPLRAPGSVEQSQRHLAGQLDQLAEELSLLGVIEF